MTFRDDPDSLVGARRLVRMRARLAENRCLSETVPNFEAGGGEEELAGRDGFWPARGVRQQLLASRFGSRLIID